MKTSIATRVSGLINLPEAMGFGCFFAWQYGIIAFLFPPSNGLVLSPLVVQSFSCCLVSIVALLGLRHNRGHFARRVLVGIVAGAVVLGTAAGVFAGGSQDLTAMTFALAVAIGCSVGVLFYAWAEVLSCLPANRRMGTATAGLAVAGLLEMLMGSMASSLPTIVFVVLLGAGGLAGFLGGMRNVHEESAPLMVRPTKSHHYKLVLLAIVLFAFVFGSVSGTTACMSTLQTARSFHSQAAVATLVIGLVYLAILIIAPEPPALAAVGRILTPLLAVLFLMHILTQGGMGGLLPAVTLGVWQFMQLFAVLLLIDVAGSGLASISLSFPLGWAVVALGFALGALFGQYVSVAFGTQESAVQSISAFHAIVAVVAASVLGAAKFPRSLAGDQVAGLVTGAPAALQDGNADQMPDAASLREADAILQLDPIDAACEDFVQQYALSDREREVLELLARGNTRASIAERLFISENTVRVHVKNIYAKLQIHSKQQLIDLVDEHAKAA